MRSLAGVGVAVTRPGEGPGELGDLVREAGGHVVHWPCIRFTAPEDPGALREAVRDGGYDWVVLTSPRAARRWLATLSAIGRPGSPPGPPVAAVAAVGPATAAAVRAAGRDVRLVADEHSAAGLVDAMGANAPLAGQRILFPHGDLAASTLPDGLEALGARVDRVVAYRTLASPPDPADVRRSAEEGRVHVVAFASGSAVDGFLAPFPWKGFDPRRVLAAAAIGPTTGAALDRAGWPAVVAREATIAGLVAAAAMAARDAHIIGGGSSR